MSTVTFFKVDEGRNHYQAANHNEDTCPSCRENFADLAHAPITREGEAARPDQKIDRICTDCFNELTKQNNTCPQCKMPVANQNEFRNDEVVSYKNRLKNWAAMGASATIGALIPIVVHLPYYAIPVGGIIGVSLFLMGKALTRRLDRVGEENRAEGERVVPLDQPLIPVGAPGVYQANAIIGIDMV